MAFRHGSIGPAAAACWLVAACGVRAGEVSQLDAFTIEPRAFGYQVGDVLQRHIVVQVPDGLALDETSLPRPGARGHALELRALQRQGAAGREELWLHYQVFSRRSRCARSKCRRCICASKGNRARRLCASMPGR
jgi:hypothetical protein